MSYDIPRLDYQRIYVSTLLRSRETARQILGEKEFVKSEFVNEVPLCEAFDTDRKLPLWFWNVAGRMQWLFNRKRQKESRRETVGRAKQFVSLLCAEETDCAVISHGFYMHVLLKEMKKAGFQIQKLQKRRLCNSKAIGGQNESRIIRLLGRAT